MCLTKYCYGDLIKKDDMSWLCGLCGGREMHTGFLLVNLKERDHLEELGTDGRIVLKCVLEKLDWRALTGLIKLGTGKSDWLM
jgi:hypothetical protein